MSSDTTRYSSKLGCMMSFGDALARLGTDPRIQVGAVVFPVDCSAVWGIGYNGVAAGLNHNTVTTGGQLGTGASGAAHAEANALLKAGDQLHSGRPCLLYATLMPCPFCAPLIANVKSIVGVIVRDVDFNIKSGEHVLEAARIPVLRVGPDPSNTAGRIMWKPGGTTEDAEKIVTWWRSLRQDRPAMKGSK